MSFLKEFEKIISDAVDDLLGEEPAKREKHQERGWNYDDDIRAAEEELEKFLRSGGSSAYKNCAKSVKQEVPTEVRTAFVELGIAVGAPLADCKKAFRELSKKYHPDRAVAGGSSEKFLRIKSAYDTLEKWYEKK